MHELALFAGAGGGLLASKHLLGWRTVCYVEWNEYRVKVLKQRIRDGLLDDAPIWDDVRTFDGTPWRGCVDIVTAGFPCQPFSVAGKRQGKADERNMWPDTVRVIGEVKPTWCLLENVPGLLAGSHGYYGQILQDLAESGYDARWRMLSAAEVGAPHQRDRVWTMAYANDQRFPISSTGTITETRGAVEESQQKNRFGLWAKVDRRVRLQKQWSTYASLLPRDDDGVAHRVDRLATLGDGQVPAVVATVWRLLTDG